MSRVKANSVDFDNSCVALMRRLILNMRTLQEKVILQVNPFFSNVQESHTGDNNWSCETMCGLIHT